MGIDFDSKGVNIFDPSWLSTFALEMAPEDAAIKACDKYPDVLEACTAALNLIRLLKRLGGFTYGSEDLYVFPVSRTILSRLIRESYLRIFGDTLEGKYPDLTDTNLFRWYYFVRKKNNQRCKAGQAAITPDYNKRPLLRDAMTLNLYAYSGDAGGCRGVIKIGKTIDNVDDYIASDSRAANKVKLAETIGTGRMEKYFHALLNGYVEFGNEFYRPHDNVRDLIAKNFAVLVPEFAMLFKNARERFGI